MLEFTFDVLHILLYSGVRMKRQFNNKKKIISKFSSADAFRRHIDVWEDNIKVYTEEAVICFVVITGETPLWPQNKWLHTPRTTDNRHTRQDTWIQKQLAVTLAKNATKPKPFEIIPLQTTRKENNWKTEEALARAAVTLETERIKGPNLWCLWWWRKKLVVWKFMLSRTCHRYI